LVIRKGVTLDLENGVTLGLSSEKRKRVGCLELLRAGENFGGKYPRDLAKARGKTKAREILF